MSQATYEGDHEGGTNDLYEDDLQLSDDTIELQSATLEKYFGLLNKASKMNRMEEIQDFVREHYEILTQSLSLRKNNDRPLFVAEVMLQSYILMLAWTGVKDQLDYDIELIDLLELWSSRSDDELQNIPEWCADIIQEISEYDFVECQAIVGIDSQKAAAILLKRFKSIKSPDGAVEEIESNLEQKSNSQLILDALKDVKTSRNSTAIASSLKVLSSFAAKKNYHKFLRSNNFHQVLLNCLRNSMKNKYTKCIFLADLLEGLKIVSRHSSLLQTLVNDDFIPRLNQLLLRVCDAEKYHELVNVSSEGSDFQRTLVLTYCLELLNMCSHCSTKKGDVGASIQILEVINGRSPSAERVQRILNLSQTQDCEVIHELLGSVLEKLSSLHPNTKEATKSDWTPQTCSNCKKNEQKRNEFKTCALCKAVFYCCKKCQKQDWKKIHKKNCKKNKDD